MTDPRKADATVFVQLEGTRHKFELFVSNQFPNADMMAQPQYDDSDTPTFRVRHNGAWLPPGQRQLMALDDLMQIVAATLRPKLRGK